MRTLSGLDASFLYLETAESPMHVGSLHLIDLPADAPADFDYALAVRQHMHDRLHLAPLLTQRLQMLPFDIGHPSWVVDDDIDLDYHVRKIVLPAPGTQVQLEAYVARLHSHLMDRTRPLWEFTVFEGLASGQHAFYSKIHHAAMDGKAGAILANVMLDITPHSKKPPPPQKKSRQNKKSAEPQKEIGKLLAATFSNTVAQYAKIVKSIPALASGVSASLSNKDKSQKRPKMTLAPKTPLNVSISKSRTIGTYTLPFDQVRQQGKALGASFNDAIMFICSTALRRYLINHDALPSKTLLAAVPVSLRDQDNQQLNNQASMMLMELGTQHADPAQRMQAILASSAKLKHAVSQLKTVLPTDYPSLLAPWLVGGVSAIVNKGRLMDYLPTVANVVISNVPGPAVPLYLAGGQMRSFYPLSIILHSIALNITVQSYAGHVDFGITACKKAIPDVRAFVLALQAGAKELESLAKLASNMPPSAKESAKVGAGVTAKKLSSTKAKSTVLQAVAGKTKTATRAVTKAAKTGASATTSVAKAARGATRVAVRATRAAGGAAGKAITQVTKSATKKATRTTVKAVRSAVKKTAR